MSKTTSQLWLLIAVGILVGLYHVYLQAIIAVREHFLVSLSAVHLCAIGLLATVVACAVASLGKTRAVSRPVAL